MSMPIEYTSFLIRLWREARPDPHAPSAEWQGEVEHIQSGQCWAFCTLQELLDFLRSSHAASGATAGESLRSDDFSRPSAPSD